MPTYRGDRVRALREKVDLKQYELAIHAGVSQGHLSQIERSQIESVGSVILTGLARALETNVDYLVGDTDDPRAIKRRKLGDLAADEEDLVRQYRLLKDQTFRQSVHGYVQLMLNQDRRMVVTRRTETPQSETQADSGRIEESHRSR